MNSGHLPIAFVYFDLGNMLVWFDPARGCDNLATLFDVSSERARSVVYGSGLQDRFEHGDVTGEQFAEEIRRQLGKSGKQPATQTVLDAASNMFSPIAAMRGVMQRVRDAGLGVGLLSNTCAGHWDWIGRQKYDVMEFAFDTTILSFEVGSMKPDSVIFESAEVAAGVSREQILFLDDRSENVQAAVNRQWNVVCCTGGEPAIRALNRYSALGS